MKNLMYFFLFSSLTVFACKKHVEAPINKLIPGLDPSVKLPNADTTGALAYIEGYIDGERFCLADGKDSVKFSDVATNLFYYDNYQKEWNNGVGGAWFFYQGTGLFFTPANEKKWYIQFTLPTFGASRDTSQFKAFQRKYATPGIFTNFDRASLTDNLEQFDLRINREDIFDGKWQTLGLASWGDVAPGVKLDQTGSYIKLVSVTKYDYIPLTNFHYEMIYEFDLKLLAGTGVKHLTKGRMKAWVTRIKI
jgi:hypothetical protein